MTYTLHSSPLVFTPGFIAWAIAGAKHQPRQMLKIISEGYSLPKPVARALLAGSIAYTIDGETITFEA